MEIFEFADATFAIEWYETPCLWRSRYAPESLRFSWPRRRAHAMAGQRIGWRQNAISLLVVLREFDE